MGTNLNTQVQFDELDKLYERNSVENWGFNHEPPISKETFEAAKEFGEKLGTKFGDAMLFPTYHVDGSGIGFLWEDSENSFEVAIFKKEFITFAGEFKFQELKGYTYMFDEIPLSICAGLNLFYYEDEEEELI